MIPQCDPHASYVALGTQIDVAVRRVLGSGKYILGPETHAFEQEFAQAVGAGGCIGVASGTDALEIALRACGVGAGDSVATVSHTAVATVAAIARIGAVPVFVDVDPDRYTMCPESLQSVLNSPSARGCRAVVPVHIYGQPADMPRLLAVAQAHGLPVIEDCAQAHGATLEGRVVGTWGVAGCFSFYPTKNLGAFGDGGAIVSNDTEVLERARLLREYGWRERYISREFGTNSRLDEIQAAILRVKLPHLHRANRRRQEIADIYDVVLRDLPLIRPRRFDGAGHVFHQYVVRVENRDAFRSALLQREVGTLVHYPVPVHRQPAYVDQRYVAVPLATTEALAPVILSLPMFPELGEESARSVCSAIRAVLA